MSIEATLTLAGTTLQWPQTTVCETRLYNGSATSLDYVNFANLAAAPTLIVTDLDNGQTVQWLQRAPDEMFPAPVTVGAGESLAMRFVLNQRLQLPGPGNFELRARYAWSTGSVESAPVRLQVVPATVRALDCGSLRGGPALVSFCAWTDGEALWLTSVALDGPPRLEQSQRLGEASPDALPIVSVPPNTTPNRQWVAWIEGTTLHFAVSDQCEVVRGALELGAEGHHLVAPVLEAPFEPGRSQDAQALVVRETGSGWELAAAHLGLGATGLGAQVRMPGPPPSWARTAYGSDLRRRTFFLVATEPGVPPLIELSLSRWASGVDPAPPVRLTTWSGRLLAADLALTWDDAVVGAVLIAVEGPGGPYHWILRWRVSADDGFSAQPPVRLTWDGGPLDAASVVLRVNPLGEPFLLLRANDGTWAWANGQGHGKSLRPTLQRLGTPADLVFAGGQHPVVIHNAPGRGLDAEAIEPIAAAPGSKCVWAEYAPARS